MKNNWINKHEEHIENKLCYKLSIEKEEPKQICDNCKIEISKYGCGCGKPKQETLNK